MPDYTQVDDNVFNKVLLGLFRRKLVEQVGYDSKREGYSGLMEVTKVLNTSFESPKSIQVYRYIFHITSNTDGSLTGSI